MLKLALAYLGSFVVITQRTAGQVIEDPSPTLSPTYTDVCYVCGDPDLSVDPTLTVMIGVDEYSCGFVEAGFDGSQVFSPAECALLVQLVTLSCDCSNPLTDTNPPRPPATTTPPIPAPTGSNFAPTSAPSYSESCYVCGDPDLSVEPTDIVTIGNETYTCEFIQAGYDGSQMFSPLECAFLAELVTEACDCKNRLTDPNPAENAEQSSSGGSSALAGLAALALIPIVGIGLFVYFKHKSKQSKGDPNQPKVVSEVNAGGPAPLNEEEPDVFYPPPTASAATKVRHPQHNDPSGTAAASEENYHHRSTAEMSASSGRSRGPGASYRYSGKSDSGAAADLRASGRSDSGGGYLPHTKDQCRSVARAARGENVPPETIMVEAVPVDGAEEDMTHFSVSTGDGTGESRRSRRSIDP